MTSMLQALKHRGPDSSGFALYGAVGRTEADKEQGERYVMRFNLAEREDLEQNGSFSILEKLVERKKMVDKRLSELGGQIIEQSMPTRYSCRYLLDYTGDLKHLAAYTEDVEGVEILSLGKALELVKDLGDADSVSSRYDLRHFQGTHAIGHTRMATESAVDIRSAHPYWAYPFSDIAVVHNGQLTNYWLNRRELERGGCRFLSDCDSELIAVYVAGRMEKGDSLEDAMRRSVEELDGVFTYLVATSDQLGMAKDIMAAKPMVLYESGDFVALASEEIAIRSVLSGEIDTVDPYDGEVRVWET